MYVYSHERRHPGWVVTMRQVAMLILIKRGTVFLVADTRLPSLGQIYTAIASPWSPVTTGEAMEPGPFYAHYMRVT